MLTRYGFDNIIIMLSIAIILIASAFVISRSWVSYLLGTTGLLLALFTFWFFRDPDRVTPEKALNSDEYIISPADGEILEIKEVDEDIFLKKRAVQISIFLSPLNVHVNRSPASGIIRYFKYHPGDYLVAYHPKSSNKNEQTHIGLETKYGKIFFKQIVGILARRLVWDIKENDSLKVGQRFGMMKFGSRMDIMIDTSSQIEVEIGDKVLGGETIIAKLKT